MSIESQSLDLDYNDFLSIELDEDVDIDLKILSPKSNVLSALSSPTKQGSFLDSNSQDSSSKSNK